jgi:AhpD family alkylhydroperoxidase
MQMDLETYTGDPAALRLVREALQKVDSISGTSGLASSQLALIKIKASQLNRCAYCLDMHIKEALANQESYQRIYSLPVWRETPFYSKEERAMLQWTEALTRISEESIPEQTYEDVNAVLDGMTLEKVTFAVIAINAWNRLMLSLRKEPGSYRPGFNFPDPQ